MACRVGQLILGGVVKKELPPSIHLRMYSYRVCADGRKLQAFALAGGAPAGGESDFTFKLFHAVDAQGVSVLGGVKVPGKMAPFGHRFLFCGCWREAISWIFPLWLLKS